MEQNKNRNKSSKKEFWGAVTAMATVVGSVIGSGVFFKPQAIYTATGGAPGLGMHAWLITGIVSIAAALTFSEVAIMIPKTGGIVAYLEEIYNPMIGIFGRLGTDFIILSGHDICPCSGRRSADGVFYRGRLCCSGSSCHDYHYHLSEFYGIQDRWQCTSHFTVCKMIP